MYVLEKLKRSIEYGSLCAEESKIGSLSLRDLAEISTSEGTVV